MTTEQSVILRDQAGTLYEVPLSALHGYQVSGERRAEIEAALSRASMDQEVQGYYDSSTFVIPQPANQDANNSKTGNPYTAGIGVAEAVVAVVGIGTGGDIVGAVEAFSRPPF